MKVLVVGDVHWSEYSSIIRKRGDKYSKRLENLINSLNWVEELAEQRGVDRIVFLGDFFDTPNLNASEISALQEVVWSNIPHDFIVGNHEIQLENLQISSAHLFNLIPNSHVVDTPTMDGGFGYNLLYLPYCKEENRVSIKDTIKNCMEGYFTTQEVKRTIAFSHNDVKIQYGLMPPTMGYDIEDIDNSCHLFLNGHLHNGGKFSKNGYNVGNLTGQNFGEDANKYEHGVMIVDVDTLTIETIINPYAFNFYKIEINDSIDELLFLFKCNKIKNNAIVTIKTPENLVQQVKELLENYSSIVKEYRVVALPNKTKVGDEENGEVVIESINHLDEFITFVKDTIEMTPMVIEELSEVCR